MTKLFIISDIHYGDNNENRCGKNGVNTHGKLMGNLLGKIREEITRSGADIVINLGDTIHCKDRDKFSLLFHDFLNTFADLQTPMHNLYGNHDLAVLSMEELNELTGHKELYAFNYKEIKYIIMNCNRSDGIISLNQNALVWLKNELKTDKKVILLLHYPITEESNNLAYYHKPRPESAFIRESSTIRQLINDSGNVIAVISGHTHFFYETVIDKTKYITVPSFAEDDQGKPKCEYIILDVPELKIEIKKLIIV